MADRFQNINIVYKVNTVDVEKASASLNKAKAANDILIQSATKLGTEGSHAASKYSSTIAGLTLQMQQLKAQIDLTKQSDTARLEGLTSQYKQMQTQMEQYQRAVSTSATHTQSLAESMHGFYDTVKLLLTAGLVKEIVDMTIGMASLSGKVAGVREAFNKLPNSVALMESLKTATKNTVAELNLMQLAMKADNLQVPLKDLGTLMEFVHQRALATGKDFQELADAILTGIGTGNVRAMRALQISTIEIQKEFKRTGDFAEAMVNIADRELKKQGESTDNARVKVEQLAAAWENLKVTISEGWVGKLGSFFVSQFKDALSVLAGDQSESNAITAATKRVIDFQKANEKLLASDKAVVTVQREIDQLMKELPVVYGKIADAQAKVKAAGLNPSDVDTALKGVETAKLRYIEIAREIDLLKKYETSLSNKTVSERDEEKALKALQKQIDDEIAAEKRWDDQRDAAIANSKAWSDAIMKEYDKVVKHLENIIPKGLPKGSVPEGGFQGPLGPATGADTGGDTAAGTKNRLDYEYLLNASFWDKMKQGFGDMHRHIRKGTEDAALNEQEAWKRAAIVIEDSLKSIIGSATKAFESAEINSLDNKENATKAYYDAQIKMAGDNERAKESLQKKEDKAMAGFEKQKAEAHRRAAILSINMNTAMAIMEVWASTAPYYVKIAESLAVGAVGVAQLIEVNNQKFAGGVIDLKGPGTSTSDSISARLSKGESVMTAEETRNSMGILKAIRAKKIDDRYINEIIAKVGGSQSNNWDDARIVAAIQANGKSPDIVRQGAEIYEAKEVGKNAKKYIRSKYFS